MVFLKALFQWIYIFFIQLNTDCFQQIEDYVRDWQLKKVKTIYKFHKLVFDQGYSSDEFFTTEWLKTMGYGTPVRQKKNEGKNILFFVASYEG